MHAPSSLTAVAALLAALSVGPQDKPQPPVFKSGVDVVTIDVHVVDAAGQPIAGLQPEDFVVTVDGRARRAVAADFVSWPAGSRPGVAAPGAAPAPATPPDATPVPGPGRLVLIVVDEGNIRSGMARAAANAAQAFVERAPASDRIGILNIPESTIAVEPTTDRAAVTKVLPRIVGHLSSVETRMAAQVSVGLSEAFMIEHDRRGFGRVITRECVEKLAGASAPSPECVAEVQLIAREIMSDARQRVITSARSLAAIVDALARVPGPKTLVLVSEELPVSSFASERKAFESETANLSAAAARAQVDVYVVQLDRPAFDAETRLAPASSADDSYMRSFGLETVTTLTGGRRVMATGRVDGAFDRIARETSGFYVVGFEATQGDRDGKPHNVTVKVARSGADVRARRQFVFSDSTQRSLADVVAATAPPASPEKPPDIVIAPVPARDLAEVLARAGRYVTDYGEQMSLVVGVEHYTQWMHYADAAQPLTRILVSEFALVREADDWLGFRDVYEVNGAKVGDRQDRLASLLFDRSRDGLERGRRIADESARYNIGPIQRNFNLPTTALYFLNPVRQARFKYDKAGEDTVDGRRVWKVRYRETREPTIIRTSGGKNMPVFGMFWIDPVTGSVVKTEMHLEVEVARAAEMGGTARGRGGVPSSAYTRETRNVSTASISATYRFDSRLSMLLPAEMRETYDGAFVRPETQQEATSRVTCVATYSEFKQFSTAGKVIIK